jgi:hypothetical protein
MAISTIREMPPGRRAIRTEIRNRAAMPKIEAFLASEAAAGRQSFVVVPLVAESEALSAASAEAEFERLRSALPDLRIGLVHGQQKADARDATMAAFAAAELDLLVATTVIEVGIDVPNASVMLVEDADRFGLAQLHQLRGRVGRGDQQSFCILLTDAVDDRSRERLEVVRGSSDGFEIAEADLRLRGAGNVLGTRQSGLPPLKVASLFEPRHLVLAERAGTLRAGWWRRSGAHIPPGPCPNARRSGLGRGGGRRGLMRVIAGTAGGRPLVAPRGTATRPIADRVKETLFGILGERVIDASVLDLYAGSGAVGIEALSRGASHADFVETDRRALVAIRENLERTGLATLASVHSVDVLRYLEGLRDERFGDRLPGSAVRRACYPRAARAPGGQPGARRHGGRQAPLEDRDPGAAGPRHAGVSAASARPTLTFLAATDEPDGVEER